MPTRSILLLAPHPDDEVVACAAAVRRAQAEGARFYSLFLTTGLPPRSAVWPWHRPRYDRRVGRRRAEARLVASEMGVDPVAFCPWPARTLKEELSSALAHIRVAVADLRIRAIWTPAFEGAHQDHDVANFLAAQFASQCEIVEFAEYHLAKGRAVSGRFRTPDGNETVLRLDDEERRWKRDLLRLYRSERANLRHIKCETESFRPLARYDYARRPHEGRLFYERFQWMPFRHPRVDFERPDIVIEALASFAARAALIVAGVFAAFAARADTITVGSKIDTEGALLGNMIALMLESGGLGVESRIGLGPTNIVRAAILAGAIDIYPEYTGDGARFFKSEGDPVWKSAEAGYDEVRRLDLAKNRLVWLASAPANNTWAIAVRRDLAARAGTTLEGFSHYLSAGGHVRLAASAEFVESPGGLPAFEKTYGFALRQSQLLVLAGGDTAATIRAAAEDVSGVDAAMAYGTDGSLAALGLVVLADDKGAEVVYEPAPVVREAVLAAHPQIRGLLDPAFRSLTVPALQELNAKIAVDGVAAREVAKDYLVTHGFLK